ncbi:MAG TPA: hypothetical protein VIY49_11435 [Bryobacteraceae bacterium]
MQFSTAAGVAALVPEKRKGRCQRRETIERLGGPGRWQRVRFAQVPGDTRR